jgi:hypothetical protein
VSISNEIVAAVTSMPGVIPAKAFGTAAVAGTVKEVSWNLSVPHLVM